MKASARYAKIGSYAEQVCSGVRPLTKSLRRARLPLTQRLFPCPRGIFCHGCIQRSSRGPASCVRASVDTVPSPQSRDCYCS